MYTYMQIYSVTDLRQKTNEVINAALSSGYVPIIQNSKNKVSLVDSLYLASLQEAYEDNLDAQEADRIMKHIKSGKEKTLPFELKKYI